MIKVIIALNRSEIVSKDTQLKALTLKIESDNYGSNKVSDVSLVLDTYQKIFFL